MDKIKQKQILIVDDEKDVLKLLKARLNSAGYFVFEADNGVDGLALAKEHLPKLIILDVLMPGMSGGEVAKELRKDPNTKDIPIMFLTATLTKEQEVACKFLGNACFLSKPYDSKQLLETVSGIIGYGSK